MKKKVLISAAVLIFAIGCVWYIFNGGTDSEQNTEQPNTSSEQVAADSLAAVIKDQKNTKIFNELVELSSQSATLQETGPYTVLVPTDAAFKKLPEGVLDTLKKPENKAALTAVIQYHIIKGLFIESSLQNGTKLPSYTGKEVVVQIKDGTTSFVSMKGDIAQIITSDITATNGTVYTIDAVLLPQ